MIINFGQTQFNLTEEEFSKFTEAIKNSKLVWIPRLEVFLTDKFIWAGKKPADPNRRLLNDGGYAIRKFGTWYSEKMPDVKLDLRHYPELLKDIDVEDIKQLDN